MEKNNLYESVKKNEDIFRAVLREMKELAGLGIEVNPLEGLDTEADLEILLGEHPYSMEGRGAKLEIVDFRVGPFNHKNKGFKYSRHTKLDKDEASLEVRSKFNGGTNSFSHLYKINSDGSARNYRTIFRSSHSVSKIKLEA